MALSKILVFWSRVGNKLTSALRTLPQQAQPSTNMAHDQAERTNMQQCQASGQRGQRVKDARTEDVRREYLTVLAHYGSISVQDLVLETATEEANLNAAHILHKVVDTRARQQTPLFWKVRQFISLNHNPAQLFSRSPTQRAGAQSRRRASM